MQIFELAGAREFLPQRKSTSDMYGQLCRRAPQVCVNSIEAICGYDTGNLNTSMLPLYLAYTPAGEACSCCTENRQGYLQLWGLCGGTQQSGKGGTCNAAHRLALPAPQVTAAIAAQRAMHSLLSGPAPA